LKINGKGLLLIGHIWAQAVLMFGKNIATP
jgi:hypothetical protein